MDILIVDPSGTISPAAGDAVRTKGWHGRVVHDRAEVFARVLAEAPDAVVIHGDGRAGETTHLCQGLKLNPLTAGIPLVLVEDAPPAAWFLAGMPADAFIQPPFEPTELLHHLEILVPTTDESGNLDDLTDCPRRRSVLREITRRLAARELFAAGLLTLREPDAYRQDLGRSGIDQFVVLVSVVLRRLAGNATPVSIGYLEEGAFLILAAPAVVHHLVAQTIRDFEALVPAFYEMDTLFGEHGPLTGPITWVSLEGAVCLVEPGRYQNALQIGFALAETRGTGQDALRRATVKPVAIDAGQLVAD